jgi:predicted enzyme related to lactoylglutathione lyase
MAGTPLQPPNHPIWADLSSTDIEASKAFYGGLFGWEAETVAPPEAGSYTMFRKDGKMAAAVQTTMGDARPPVWQAYIHAADADETTEMARKAGGTIYMEPMDVFEDGRLAVFADPTGAVISLWQPRNHSGAEVMFEPGSIGWIELGTRDLETAKRFYGEVFEWGAETSEGPMPYTEWKLDGKSIAGAMEMGPQHEGVPPHWLVYFSVADADASASRAQELGGSVVVPPMDFPGGRFAVVADPHGAVFGLMYLKQ